jgi:hypothetical protein
MRSHLLALLVISTLGLLSNRTASANDKPDRGADETIAMQLASSYVEQQQIVRRNAPVHSAVQLAAFLARTTRTESPINALSPAAKVRFIDSLRFNEAGVTSFYYADIDQSSPSARLTSSFRYLGCKARCPSCQNFEQLRKKTSRSCLHLVVRQHPESWRITRTIGAPAVLLAPEMSAPFA